MKRWVKWSIGIGVVAVIAIVGITCGIVFGSSTSTCVLSGNSLDDLDTVKENCKDIIVEDLRVPAGKTLDFTGISDTKITFKGNISFEYLDWKGPLVLISGRNISVTGSEGHVIDGQGARWWDGLGANGGITKPRFFKARYVYNATIRNLNFLNSPRHCFAIHNCTDIVVSNININTKDGDVQGGHNTDGFNVKGSENVYISDVVVYNQDDCLAVRSGKNIHFSRGFCSGGHGLSIGSIGNRTNNELEDVYVSDCEVVDSENGVRIKTVVNMTGSVNGVYYNNITISNITNYGILIRGDYMNVPGPTGIPSNTIPITNVNFTNIRGTVQPTGTNIFILIGDSVASNWYWSNINITGGTNNYQSCQGIPQDAVGVFCS